MGTVNVLRTSRASLPHWGQVSGPCCLTQTLPPHSLALLPSSFYLAEWIPKAGIHGVKEGFSVLMASAS